jgi:non-ribosomal peptide synthetase component F
MGLLSIYNILLSRVSGQEDIVIGTGIAGRRHADLQNIIGMFVNTLALRNRPEGRKSFITFLREVRQKTLLAYENQDFQFEELVEKIVKEKNNNRNPLFDAAIMMQNVQLETEVPEIEGNLLKIKPYGYQKMMSKFDIVLICLEADNKLVLSFDYCVKLFKPETIKMLISHFKEIVAAVVANKHIHLDQIVLSNDLVSMSPGTFQKEQGDFVF